MYQILANIINNYIPIFMWQPIYTFATFILVLFLMFNFVISSKSNRVMMTLWSVFFMSLVLWMVTLNIHKKGIPLDNKNAIVYLETPTIFQDISIPKVNKQQVTLFRVMNKKTCSRKTEGSQQIPLNESGTVNRVVVGEIEESYRCDEKIAWISCDEHDSIRACADLIETNFEQIVTAHTNNTNQEVLIVGK